VIGEGELPAGPDDTGWLPARPDETSTSALLSEAVRILCRPGVVRAEVRPSLHSQIPVGQWIAHALANLETYPCLNQEDREVLTVAALKTTALGTFR
jgi:hypothetical protein